jgi:hypothetical protein
MLPFINQVRTSANFSLRACCPLAGLETPSFNNDEYTYAGLKKQVSDTSTYLIAIPDEKFIGSMDKHFQDKAGFSELSLPGSEYLHQYALPNFFFHLSMVYAITRSRGIPISKGDFDGYHSYPMGFSFEK